MYSSRFIYHTAAFKTHTPKLTAHNPAHKKSRSLVCKTIKGRTPLSSVHGCIYRNFTYHAAAFKTHTL